MAAVELNAPAARADRETVSSERGAAPREELATPVDQERVNRARLLQESKENPVDAVGGLFVNCHVVGAHRGAPCSCANPLTRTIRDTVLSVSNTPLPSTATASK